MPLAEVGEWAARFPAGTDGAIDAIAPAVRARGHFLRDEFLTAYRWKTHRTLYLAEKYTEEQIADVRASPSASATRSSGSACCACSTASTGRWRARSCTSG